MVRKNTPTEIEFQQRIVDAFNDFDKDVGFSAMTDVMLSWLVYEMQERKLTLWGFIKIMTLTWVDVAKIRKEDG